MARISLKNIFLRILLGEAAARGATEVSREIARGEVHEEEPRHPSVRFEPQDVSGRRVFFTGLGVLAGMFVLALVTLPIFMFFSARHSARYRALPVRGAQTQVPPPPRLQRDPRRDLQEFRAREQTVLDSYGWVDRAHGVVSIPIERAMQIVAQQGIPPRKAPPGNVYYDPHEGSLLPGFDERDNPVLK
jgi:hypothetical protein